MFVYEGGGGQLYLVVNSVVARGNNCYRKERFRVVTERRELVMCGVG